MARRRSSQRGNPPFSSNGSGRTAQLPGAFHGSSPTAHLVSPHERQDHPRFPSVLPGDAPPPVFWRRITHPMIATDSKRPRNVDWTRAAAILYGDWGTSKAYVVGLGFALPGYSSFWLI